MSLWAGAFDNSEVLCSSSYSPIVGNSLSTEDLYDKKIKQYSDKDFIKKIAHELCDEKKLSAILDTRARSQDKVLEYELKIANENLKKEEAQEQYNAAIDAIKQYFLFPDDKQIEILTYIGEKHNLRMFEASNKISKLKSEKKEHDELLLATKEISDRLEETWEKKHPAEERYLCKICYDRHVNRIIPTCGHTFCDTCIDKMHNKCEFCQEKFTKVTNIFLS